MTLILPPFGKFLDKLHEAGLDTGTARGFWGGKDGDGTPVVTSWIDNNDGSGRFNIWKPKTNHGGLRTEWEVGNIRVGVDVKLILLRQRGNLALGVRGRSVAEAALFPRPWRVTRIRTIEGEKRQAVVEPSPEERPRLRIQGYSPDDHGIHEVSVQVIDGLRCQNLNIAFSTAIKRSEVSSAVLGEFRKITDQLVKMVPRIEDYICDDAHGRIQIEGRSDVLDFRAHCAASERNDVRDEFLMFAAAANGIAESQQEVEFHYPHQGAAA